MDSWLLVSGADCESSVRVCVRTLPPDGLTLIQRNWLHREMAASTKNLNKDFPVVLILKPQSQCSYTRYMCYSVLYC